MSGGGSQTTQSGPPSWAIPYFQSYYNKAGSVADLPYQPYTDQRIADLNPYQTGGLAMTAQRAITGDQGVNQAKGALSDTLGGSYFGNVATNPYSGPNSYLQGMIDTASQDVTKNYRDAVTPSLDAARARSGSFGNSGLDQVQAANENTLAKNLGQIQNQYRFQDYQTQQNLGESAANRAQGAYEAERGRQFQGIGLAPELAKQGYIDAGALSGVGDVLGKYQQGLLDTQYQNFLEARDYPRQQLGTLGQALGINAGSQTTSQGAKGSPAAGALGGAAAGASLAPMLSIAGPYGAAAGAALGLLGSK